MPCECGSTDAYWHGDGDEFHEDGIREYMCDVCWTRRTQPITVQEVLVTDPITRARTTMFVAHGPPGGPQWLLKRLTAEAAATDGAAHLARYWAIVNGVWTPQAAE